MGRIRTIKPQFFTSEDVTSLPALARLLFLGLLTEADREGRLEDKPRTLKVRLLPEDDCDLDDLLWVLAERGLIRRYQAEACAVIQVCRFAMHQRPHPKEPDSSLPPNGVDRATPLKKPRMHDSCIPSSPVEGKGREGKEYGVLEGKGSTPPVSPSHEGDRRKRRRRRKHNPDPWQQRERTQEVMRLMREEGLSREDAQRKVFS